MRNIIIIVLSLILLYVGLCYYAAQREEAEIQRRWGPLAPWIKRPHIIPIPNPLPLNPPPHPHRRPHWDDIQNEGQ